MNNYNVTDNYQYDALGSITPQERDRLQLRAAAAPAPHAVCSLTNGTTTSSSFIYDTAGNMTSGNGRTVTYDASNRATEIDGDVPGQMGTEKYIYGADGDRGGRDRNARPRDPKTRPHGVRPGLGNVGKSLYERTTIGGVVQHVHFIYRRRDAEGNAIAVRGVLDDTGTPKSDAVLRLRSPRLGDCHERRAGQRGERRVRGRKRHRDGLRRLGIPSPRRRYRRSSSLFNQQTGRREFTGQETIPGVGLVNLNGRLYDPGLGRFLSPDLVVQALTDLQAYNRYSYAANNPLRTTDPTGFSYLTGSSLGDTILDTVVGAVAAVTHAAAPGIGCVFFFAFLEADIQMGRNLGSGMGTGTALGTLVFATAVNFVADEFTQFINTDPAGKNIGANLMLRVVSGATASMVKLAGENILTPDKLFQYDLLAAAEAGAIGATLGWAFSMIPNDVHDNSIVEAPALGDAAGSTAYDAGLGPFSQQGFDNALNTALKSTPSYTPAADPGDLSFQASPSNSFNGDPHFTPSGGASSAMSQGFSSALQPGSVSGSGSIGLSLVGASNGAFYSSAGGSALPMASFQAGLTSAPNLDGLASGFAAAGANGAFYAPQVDGQIVAGAGGLSAVRPVGSTSGTRTFAIPVP